MNRPTLNILMLLLATAGAASGDNAPAAPATGPVRSGPYIPPGTDLAPLLTTAKPGAVLQCQPNAAYRLGATTTVAASGVTLYGNGATLAMTTSPGASSNLVVRGPHFHADGLAITGGTVCFRIYADGCTLSNCSTGYCTTFAQTDVGGTNFSLLYCKVSRSIKVGVYLDQSGATVDHCYLGASDQEYSSRLDIASNNVKATGVKFTNTIIYNPRDAANTSKDALGIRVGDCLLSHCTITNDIRVGQVPKTGYVPKPGEYGNVTMADNTIDGIPDTIQGVMVYQGSIVQCTDLTITAINAMGVDANSSLTCDTTMHWVPQPGPMKPLIAISSKGQHSEVHTTTAMVPAPAK